MSVRSVLFAVVLAMVVWGSASAQPVTFPSEIVATIAPGSTVEVDLIISTAVDNSVEMCLDSADPLQEYRTASSAVDTLTFERNPCGVPGEILHVVELPYHCWSLTMSTDGDVYCSSSVRIAYKFNVKLEQVAQFTFPGPLGFVTVGMTYMRHGGSDQGTLWWQQSREQTHPPTVVAAHLLEGTLDGVATGRQFDVDPGPPLPPFETGIPVGAAFDATAYDVSAMNQLGLIFFLNYIHNTIYAVDTTGAPGTGFPVPATSYANPDNPSSTLLGFGIDAHSGVMPPVVEVVDDAEEVLEAFAHRGRLEIPVGTISEGRISRVVVTDRLGRDVGSETSLISLLKYSAPRPG